MGISNERGGLAFGLTCAAGLATTFGAAVVFNKRLVHLANNAFLASSLSFAAGVMMYVSFVEIFIKSEGAFADAGESENVANAYATACFFGGVIFGNFLDWTVHYINGDANHHDVVMDVDELRRELEEAEAWERRVADEGAAKDQAALSGVELVQGGAPIRSQAGGGAARTDALGELETAAKPGEESTPEEDGRTEDSQRLVRMGLMTALAIGIHNLPEGLATFVGTLDDPAVGVGLAVAIAIHNIPEGLCVAIPIYYATHDRWQAFKWAFISGISEPIGAGLGWAVLHSIIDDRVYGIVFGLVGGMMVNICIHELLPTAFRYDPGDRITTKSFIAGMAVMALSLILFRVA